MQVAEVVETTDDRHSRVQGCRLVRQGARAPGQRIKSLAKGRIEPLDEGGVDGALPLGGVNEVLNHLRRPVDDTPRNRELLGGAVFDHLYDGDRGPRDQARLTMFARPAG